MALATLGFLAGPASAECKSGESPFEASQLKLLSPDFQPLPSCTSYCTGDIKPSCVNRTLQISTLPPCAATVTKLCQGERKNASFQLGADLYSCDQIDSNGADLVTRLCRETADDKEQKDIVRQLKYGILTTFAAVSMGLALLLCFITYLPWKRYAASAQGNTGGAKKDAEVGSNYDKSTFFSLEKPELHYQYHDFNPITYGLQLPMVIRLHEVLVDMFKDVGGEAQPWNRKGWTKEKQKGAKNDFDKEWGLEEIWATITNQGQNDKILFWSRSPYQTKKHSIRQMKETFLEAISMVSEELRQEPFIESNLDKLFDDGCIDSDSKFRMMNTKKNKENGKNGIDEIDFIAWYLSQYRKMHETAVRKKWAGCVVNVRGLGLCACWVFIIMFILIAIISIELLEDEATDELRKSIHVMGEDSNYSYIMPTVTPLDYSFSGNTACGTVETLFYKIGAFACIPLAIMVHFLVDFFAGLNKVSHHRRPIECCRGLLRMLGCRKQGQGEENHVNELHWLFCEADLTYFLFEGGLFHLREVFFGGSAVLVYSGVAFAHFFAECSGGASSQEGQFYQTFTVLGIVYGTVIFVSDFIVIGYDPKHDRYQSLVDGEDEENGKDDKKKREEDIENEKKKRHYDAKRKDHSLPFAIDCGTGMRSHRTLTTKVLSASWIVVVACIFGSLHHSYVVNGSLFNNPHSPRMLAVTCITMYLLPMWLYGFVLASDRKHRNDEKFVAKIIAKLEMQIVYEKKQERGTVSRPELVNLLFTKELQHKIASEDEITYVEKVIADSIQIEEHRITLLMEENSLDKNSASRDGTELNTPADAEMAKRLGVDRKACMKDTISFSVILDCGRCDPERTDNVCDLMLERLKGDEVLLKKLSNETKFWEGLKKDVVDVVWTLTNRDSIGINYVDGVVAAKHEILPIDRSIDGPNTITYYLLLLSVMSDTYDLSAFSFRPQIPWSGPEVLKAQLSLPDFLTWAPRQIHKLKELFKPLLFWYSMNIFHISFIMCTLLLCSHTLLIFLRQQDFSEKLKALSERLIPDQKLNAATFFIRNTAAMMIFPKIMSAWECTYDGYAISFDAVQGQRCWTDPNHLTYAALAMFMMAPYYFTMLLERFDSNDRQSVIILNEDWSMVDVQLKVLMATFSTMMKDRFPFLLPIVLLLSNSLMLYYRQSVICVNISKLHFYRTFGLVWSWWTSFIATFTAFMKVYAVSPVTRAWLPFLALFVGYIVIAVSGFRKYRANFERSKVIKEETRFAASKNGSKWLTLESILLRSLNYNNVARLCAHVRRLKLVDFLGSVEDQEGRKKLFNTADADKGGSVDRVEMANAIVDIFDPRTFQNLDAKRNSIERQPYIRPENDDYGRRVAPYARSANDDYFKVIANFFCPAKAKTHPFNDQDDRNRRVKFKTEGKIGYGYITKVNEEDGSVSVCADGISGASNDFIYKLKGNIGSAPDLLLKEVITVAFGLTGIPFGPVRLFRGLFRNLKKRQYKTTMYKLKPGQHSGKIWLQRTAKAAECTLVRQETQEKGGKVIVELLDDDAIKDVNEAMIVPNVEGNFVRMEPRLVMIDPEEIEEQEKKMKKKRKGSAASKDSTKPKKNCENNIGNSQQHDFLPFIHIPVRYEKVKDERSEKDKYIARYDAGPRIWVENLNENDFEDRIKDFVNTYSTEVARYKDLKNITFSRSPRHELWQEDTLDYVCNTLKQTDKVMTVSFSDNEMKKDMLETLLEVFDTTDRDQKEEIKGLFKIIQDVKKRYVDPLLNLTETFFEFVLTKLGAENVEEMYNSSIVGIDFSNNEWDPVTLNKAFEVLEEDKNGVECLILSNVEGNVFENLKRSETETGREEDEGEGKTLVENGLAQGDRFRWGQLVVEELDREGVKLAVATIKGMTGSGLSTDTINGGDRFPNKFLVLDNCNIDKSSTLWENVLGRETLTGPFAKDFASITLSNNFLNGVSDKETFKKCLVGERGLLTNLLELNLSYCNVGPKGLQALSEVFRDDCVELTLKSLVLAGLVVEEKENYEQYEVRVECRIKESAINENNVQFDEGEVVNRMDQDLESFFLNNVKDTKAIGRPQVNIVPPSELEMKVDKKRKEYKCFQISLVGYFQKLGPDEQYLWKNTRQEDKLEPNTSELEKRFRDVIKKCVFPDSKLKHAVKLVNKLKAFATKTGPGDNKPSNARGPPGTSSTLDSPSMLDIRVCSCRLLVDELDKKAEGDFEIEGEKKWFREKKAPRFEVHGRRSRQKMETRKRSRSRSRPRRRIANNGGENVVDGSEIELEATTPKNSPMKTPSRKGSQSPRKSYMNMMTDGEGETNPQVLFEHLLESVKNNETLKTNLEHLDISDNVIVDGKSSSASVQHICDIIQAFSWDHCLKSVHIRNIGIEDSPEDIEKIEIVLRDHSIIKFMSFGAWSILQGATNVSITNRSQLKWKDTQLILGVLQNNRSVKELTLKEISPVVDTVEDKEKETLMKAFENIIQFSSISKMNLTDSVVFDNNKSVDIIYDKIRGNGSLCQVSKTNMVMGGLLPTGDFDLRPKNTKNAGTQWTTNHSLILRELLQRDASLNEFTVRYENSKTISVSTINQKETLFPGSIAMGTVQGATDALDSELSTNILTILASFQASNDLRDKNENQKLCMKASGLETVKCHTDGWGVDSYNDEITKLCMLIDGVRFICSQSSMAGLRELEVLCNVVDPDKNMVEIGEKLCSLCNIIAINKNKSQLQSIVLPRFGETTNSKIHEKTAVEISKIVTISTLASFKMYDMISAEHRKDLDVCKLELMYMRVFEKLSERKENIELSFGCKTDGVLDKKNFGIFWPDEEEFGNLFGGSDMESTLDSSAVQDELKSLVSLAKAEEERSGIIHKRLRTKQEHQAKPLILLSQNAREANCALPWVVCPGIFQGWRNASFEQEKEAVEIMVKEPNERLSELGRKNIAGILWQEDHHKTLSKMVFSKAGASNVSVFSREPLAVAAAAWEGIGNILLSEVIEDLATECLLEKCIKRQSEKCSNIVDSITKTYDLESKLEQATKECSKLFERKGNLIWTYMEHANSSIESSRRDLFREYGPTSTKFVGLTLVLEDEKRRYDDAKAADESIENLLATLENVSSSLNEMKYDFNNQCKDSVKIVNRIRNEPKDYLYVVKKNESKDLEAPVWPVNDVAELIAKVRNKHAEIKETRRLRNRAVQESKEMNEDLSNSRDDFQSKCEVHQSKVQHAKSLLNNLKKLEGNDERNKLEALLSSGIKEFINEHQNNLDELRARSEGLQAHGVQPLESQLDRLIKLSEEVTQLKKAKINDVKQQLEEMKTQLENESETSSKMNINEREKQEENLIHLGRLHKCLSGKPYHSLEDMMEKVGAIKRFLERGNNADQTTAFLNTS